MKGEKYYDEKTVYTTSDIAGLILRDRETVRRYCEKGKIRAKKLGGEYAISDASLREFLGDDIYCGVIDSLPSLPADEWEKGAGNGN